MTKTEVLLDGVFIIQNDVFKDSRGKFYSSHGVGRVSENAIQDFEVAQINNSISASGVIRGIHFSKATNGQAKLVTCLRGSIMDFVIDLRFGSKSFLNFVTVNLKEFDGKSIFIPHGYGHGFLSLEDETIISYALSSPYSPSDEYSISPMDPLIKHVWGRSNFVLSDRDKDAPGFEAAIKSGLLGLDKSNLT